MDLGMPIASGNTAEIYLKDNKIIKIFNDYLPETEAIYEANKQKLAYSLGLPVPKIVDVTTIKGKQAIVMEYIKGRTLGSLVSESMDKAKYYMEISIEAQREVHYLVTDSIEPMREKLIRQIEQAAVLDSRYKVILTKQLNSFTYEKRLCHGDFHLFNLIKSDNRVTIIDWVDSSSGDIRADVCRTYILYLEVSRDLAEKYLQLYCLKSGLLKEEILQWVPIIAGARLSENLPIEKSKYLLNMIHQHCPL